MAWFMALLAGVLLWQAVPVGEMIATLDGRYNSMTSWQADFTQILTQGNATHTESGVLFLKKPGRMRWDIQQPARKLFLIDGRSVWLYTPGQPEAQRTDLKSDDDLRTPLRFLLGHTDLQKELAGISYGGLDPLIPGDAVLHGAPRAADSGWREVWFEVSPAFEIDRIVIDTGDGARNDIRLSQIKPNAALPAALFKFTPPPGVAVVPGPAGGG